MGLTVSSREDIFGIVAPSFSGTCSVTIMGDSQNRGAFDYLLKIFEKRFLFVHDLREAVLNINHDQYAVLYC